jgi:hypothetical protein
LCFFPTTTLNKGASINDLTANGKPVLDTYFYDPATGWLFLNVAQNRPNALGASPLGACPAVPTPNDPYFCPSKTGGESYYVCPAEGCLDYGIVLNDSSWTPAASACPDPYVTYGTPPTPPLDAKLVLASDNSNVTRVQGGGINMMFPHYLPASEPPMCTTPAP